MSDQTTPAFDLERAIAATVKARDARIARRREEYNAEVLSQQREAMLHLAAVIESEIAPEVRAAVSWRYEPYEHDEYGWQARAVFNDPSTGAELSLTRDHDRCVYNITDATTTTLYPNVLWSRYSEDTSERIDAGILLAIAELRARTGLVEQRRVEPDHEPDHTDHDSMGPEERDGFAWHILANGEE